MKVALEQGGHEDVCADNGSKPLSQSELVAVLERWVEEENQVEPEDLPFQQKTQPDDDTNGDRIDRKALDQIRQLDQDGSAGILQKVLQIYLDESSALFKKIQNAIRERDAEGLQAAAHSLKSSSAQIGALGFSEFCKEMEVFGRRESIGGAEEIYPQAELEYEEVRKALSMELCRYKEQVNGDLR